MTQLLVALLINWVTTLIIALLICYESNCLHRVLAKMTDKLIRIETMNE